MYHYKLCGLSNVHLHNGYTILESKHGKAHAVENVRQLHKVIGQAIINSSEPLDGEEVRFLRKEMLLSQVDFGDLLGLSESSIRKLETNKHKNKAKKSGSTDRLIRIFYANYLNEKSLLRKTIDRMSKIKNENSKQKFMCFKEINNSWKQEEVSCA